MSTCTYNHKLHNFTLKLYYTTLFFFNFLSFYLVLTHTTTHHTSMHPHPPRLSLPLPLYAYSRTQSSLFSSSPPSCKLTVLNRDIWLENETEICILLEYFKDGTLNDLVAKVAAQVPLTYLPENVSFMRRSERR